MIRWEQLDSAGIPGGGQLRLYRRGTEYSIRVDGQELMNSRQHGSEEELARRVCERLAERKRPRLLVGGLGMGYTVAAALSGLADDAEVCVAELVPAVVQWNRDVLAHLAGHPLADPRVLVHTGDVADVLRAARRHFDAVVLDVDNGPRGLTRNGNDTLYGLAGLSLVAQALRRRGVLGVWSAGPDRRFALRLRQSGFDAEELRVPARPGGRGGQHTLWIGTRGSS